MARNRASHARVPRVGIPVFGSSSLPDAVRDAGGEPVPLQLPQARPAGGVALAREWVADVTEVMCASEEELDALLLSSEKPEELAGLLLAAVRLDIPSVAARPFENTFAVALAALGFAPMSSHFSDIVVEVAREDGPRPRDLLDDFPLANALRAGLALDGGPELLVHLLALAKEARVVDFSRMVRVLAPENPAVTGLDSEWFREHGVRGLLAALGDDLHDTPTVAGPLKENLPPPGAGLPEGDGPRLEFVEGRSSGVECVCRVSGGATEVSGECAVFDSEEDAVMAVRKSGIEEGNIVVVRGCGPRGGPGLSRLESLAEALEKSAIADSIPVLTDGVVPEGAKGTWISLFTPEAAAEGIIGRLRDRDYLRFDLEKGNIRTKVGAEIMDQRKSLGKRSASGRGYAERYARSAIFALQGAGFR